MTRGVVYRVAGDVESKTRKKTQGAAFSLSVSTTDLLLVSPASVGTSLESSPARGYDTRHAPCIAIDRKMAG